MLIERADGTYDGGIYDVICILHDVKTNKYHTAFFEEKPFPGQANVPLNELTSVRLKSKMHHTEGSDTLEEEMKHLENLKSKIHLPEKNIWLEPKEWDGTPAIVWLLPVW